MLELENVVFRYSRRAEPVLRGVSLTLNDGKIGILLGKNGAGKTTLFQCILGLAAPESGSIRFDGGDLLKMPRRERAKLVAYVPQHIHFGALSVFDSILLGRVSRFGMQPGREDIEAAEHILAEMHLEPLANRSAEDCRRTGYWENTGRRQFGIKCNGPPAQPAGDCLGFEKTLNKTPSGCKMIKAAALKAERLFS